MLSFPQILDEEWRVTPGGSHMVSSYGRVYSLPRRVKTSWGTTRSVRGRFLKMNVSPTGYRRVSLDHKYGPVLVHRLVAEAFIPNPQGKETVNHKNGDKLDNSIHNLEWMTNSENVLHAHEAGLVRDNRRPIICVDTGKVYPSLEAASQEYGLAKGNLCSTLRGNQKRWGGHRWSYADGP